VNLRPFVLALLLPAASDAAAPAPDAAFFESKVRPLLTQRCFECHSHDRKIKGGLTLDSRSGWEKGGDTGPALIPGKPDESLLIKAIGHLDKDLAMPPKKKLSDEEIATLTEWVKMGAPDPRKTAQNSGASVEEARHHWAFQPITNPPVPPSPFAEKSTAPIDAFLFSAMAGHGLQPAPLADRSTLLRRATYDLTGLPPSAEEITAFFNDPRPDDQAFAQVIDRLLASPAYGEKWGRYWLDLVHYADTTGCSSDWPIDDMWRYRDWVVAAFNDDKPFDRFLTEQLAGDLLATDLLKRPGPLDEKAYRDCLVATGFLATAKRFGSDPGAYDYLTIGDTLDTSWKALQGLTLACARCHDHKFDPISSQDYYALYGVFASSLYPYTGAEKNQNASLLVPLAAPRNSERTLDLWNRGLPSPASETKPRSVLASFSNRWGFEDSETSEQVADRAPVSPWVTQGGVAARDGNSPFIHLLPRGIKLVDFQATAKLGEMKRRVRWADERSETRSFAIDVQLTGLWDANKQRLTLAWQSQNDAAVETVLATIAGPGLSFRKGEDPVALAKMRWHHLALQCALDSATLRMRLWDESGHLLADSQLPFEAAGSMRAPGNLIVRFEVDAPNDKRQACVRVDNIVAAADRLPEPTPADILLASPKPSPSVAGGESDESKRQAAEAQKAVEAQREETYRAVLPQKPETAFAMWEGTPHDVALQKRGEPANPGIVVPRRNLQFLGGQPVAQPGRESGRRDLAHWLLDDTNPLTLRVFANRLWQWHFGRGIVATPNDFGHKGEAPTHPELLDFLVGRFRADGLSIKAMHREIMLSYAYRQAATPAADGGTRDPENRWLARFSPRRLTAEEVRDSALAVSGLLDTSGAGYRQPFPPLNQRNWSQHGPFSLGYEANYPAYEHHKRSIYLPVVRLVPDPFLSTFDGADSNQSVAMRGETAVPLQALALLNAPCIVEAANSVAATAAAQASDADAVRLIHRRIFAADPSEPMESKLTAHLARLTHDRGFARQEALAVIAQSLLGSNGFLYVF